MNIFYLSNDPKVCAEYHCDKHVVKMIIEYAQLLSTAHRVLDGTPDITLSDSGRKRQTFVISDDRDSLLYRATHINHPSTIWVRQSSHNYKWLYQMWIHLLKEYNLRYGKIHACSKLIDPLATIPNSISDTEFTDPTPAMPDHIKIPGKSLESYRAFYKLEKARFAKWKLGNIPEWFKNETEVH